MTPTPNTPLTAEDVTLLKAGDVLRAVESTVSFSVGEIVTVEGIEDWGNTSEINVFGLSWMPSRFTFIGRPGPDGWLPIDSAPKDGTKFQSQDRTNYERRSFRDTYWYVHPSVQAWVTAEIDCCDYEFSPTHWKPQSAILSPANIEPEQDLCIGCMKRHDAEDLKGGVCLLCEQLVSRCGASLSPAASEDDAERETVCNECGAQDQAVLIDWNGIYLCPVCDSAERKAQIAEGFIATPATEPGGESGAVLAEMNELRVLLDSLRAEDDGYRVQGDDDLPLRVLRRLFTALSSSPPAQAGAVAHAELRKAAEAAAKIAPGLWGSDIEKGEGEYGIGDNTNTGYMVPYMETEYGKRLFDAHNTDVGLIEEDYSFDENGAHHSAWDENSQVIFEYLALVQPANIIALLYAHPSGLAGAVEDLRGHSGVEKTYWHMIRMAKERGFSSVSDAIEAAGAVEVARKALEPLEALVVACEAEFISEKTEGGSFTYGEPDESPVAYPSSNITFGHVRRARQALAALAPTAGEGV